jgi:3-oxoacyl-[acyl-carrier protein] reductase
MPDHPPVVLVTGASRGLGRGIAVQLAGAGFSVAINFAGNHAAAAETASLCADARIQERQRFLPVRADVGSGADRSAMLETIFSEFGYLDALVNNAGVAPTERRDLIEASESSFENVLRTNLQGPYFLTQEVARHWIERRPVPRLPAGFRVVFVTSISSHTASVNRGEYCISKAALSMAVQLWAVRLAAEQIQVYEVRPGIMQTDMTSGVREKYDRLIDEGLVPQKRWGTAEDVGLAVRSLVEGDFPFSTGTVIDVDGGFHLRRL